LVQSLWLLLWLVATVTLATGYVMRGEMTIGEFVLLNAYILQLWMPLDLLGFAYRDIRMGQTNVERMLSLLDEKIEVVERADAVEFSPGDGELRFDDVVFSYEPGRKILDGVSFVVPRGRTVAITGPSGGGKSTVARLILRFYDVCSGQITMSGHPIEACTLASLRAAVAVVPQDGLLLNDTIADNIGIGQEGCDQADIEDAARLAQIHDFIVSLPDGYQTVVGERGVRLSGGQKQRVAIARALLKRTKFLIFDEATSALDNGTESAVQSNVRRASRGVAMLIITHRLSSIVDVDEIVVLNEGRIVERGRHDELLRLQGLYADMWRRQQNEGDEEIDRLSHDSRAHPLHATKLF
jgi:ATP-binding cassette subfamily B protein